MAFNKAYYQTPLVVLFQYLKFAMRQEAMNFYLAIAPNVDSKTAKPFLEKINKLSPDYDDTEEKRIAKIDAKIKEYNQMKRKERNV